MTTTARHPLVEEYRSRLWAEAAQLPVDQARELVADIDEHLDTALPEGASEAEVRNVLERLGTPHELVAASGPMPEPPPSKSFASPVGAIVCLVGAEVFSILLPISLPLWILGLVMMARATVWSERDKLLGFLALGSGFPAATAFWLLSLVAVRSCSSVYENGRLVSDDCAGVDPVVVIFWALTAAYLVFQVYVTWRLVRSAQRR